MSDLPTVIRALRPSIYATLLTFALGASCLAQTSAKADPDPSVTPSTASTPLCPIPSSPGVNVCSPARDTSGPYNPQVQILASARGASGAVNHIEIWVDGKKVRTVLSNQVNTLVTLGTGQRRVTLVEVDSAGAFVKSDPHFAGVVASNGCAAPGAAGVNMCSPEPQQCAVGPLQITATGTAKSGSVNHMELWINGRKYSQFPGAQVNTALEIPLNEFNRVVVVVVDSAGNAISSTPVTVSPC
jgi:hypothetical protein